ncbi:hypothetical protein BGX31_010250 [Mortierella sp. GBA43]|nr:hypothetical protein BGX31_010250 [Mortierella sp. GBA43]
MANRARKQEKKAAAAPLSDLEKAIRDIDLATEAAEAAKQRKPCYCLATKHKLNVFAPNCLSCGKIICALEGPGPCTFCGNPVVSIEQQQAMVLELRREKAALAKQRSMATAKRKIKAPANTAGYASKVGGGLTSSTGSDGGWYGISGMTEDEELEEAKKASLALEHKERLLEYDRTSAPASGYHQRAKVMTIDVVNRRVVVEASAPPRSQDNEDDDDDVVAAPVNVFDQIKSTSTSGGNRHGGRGGAFAMNPLLKLGEKPTFISTKGKAARGTKESILRIKAEKPKMSRVQYDDGYLSAEMDISISSGGDSQDVLASIVEPSCG